MRAVNLLPADLRGAVKAPAPVAPAPEDGGGSGAFVVLGALALCALALAAYVLTTNEIKQQQADLDQLNAKSEAVTREVNALKPYADFQAMAETRVSTVRDLSTQRFDWEHALRDLARVIPADVTVKKLSGSVSADAGGDSPLRGAIGAPAVTLDGCTSDQESVARLMARVRTVSGVTRVSLAKSNKPDAAAGGASIDAAAPTVGGPDAPAGCSGKGDDQAPDFQIVAFFEGDTAATAATAAATPGAAAPPAAQDAAAANGTPSAVRDAVGHAGRRRQHARLDLRGGQVMRSNKLVLGVLSAPACWPPSGSWSSRPSARRWPRSRRRSPASSRRSRPPRRRWRPTARRVTPTRRPTPASPASARRCPPTTTSGRWSCSSTPRRRAAR